ncbi:MAG: hypothetical protein V3V62_08840, partial [bacterium]
MTPPAPGGEACVLLHYNEIGLKGKNRPIFVDRLAQRVQETASPFGGGACRRLPGRLFLEMGERADWPSIREALARVFGLANFARARHLPLDREAVCAAALEMLAPLKTASFRVRTRKG